MTWWSPPGYEEVPLAIPLDGDPDPRRIEIELRARRVPRSFAVSGADARTIDLWTYDGALPGPLIRAKRGDTLAVRFLNELDVSSTVHWHGVRVPNAMDGTHDTQAPVPPGGEFRYSFPLPDAGAFWYHPHHMSSQQVGMGLYGPLVVADEAEPADLGEPAVLLLSDMAMDGHPTNVPMPGDQGAIEAAKHGREGAILLVNGKQHPTISLVAARRHRWLIVNASANRFFRLAVAGHTLTRIGGDGGFLEEPLPALPDVLLIPGERADITFVLQGEPGRMVAVESLPYDRGNGEGAPEHLMNLAITAPPTGSVEPAVPPLPQRLRSLDRLIVDPGTPVDEVAIGDRPEGFVVNGLAGGSATMRAKVGELRVIDVVNHTGHDHPIHLHGFFFQALDAITLLPSVPVEWKDTANVRALSRRQFAVRYDDRVGPWMLHCHILDHSELGLSATVQLAP